MPLKQSFKPLRALRLCEKNTGVYKWTLTIVQTGVPAADNQLVKWLSGSGLLM